MLRYNLRACRILQRSGETILLVGEHEFTGAPFPGSPYQSIADSHGAWTISWDGGDEHTSEGPYQLRLSAADSSVRD